MERFFRGVKSWLARHRNTFAWVGYYTLFFLVTAGLVFVYVALKGQSFLRDSDGITQHFPALYYYNLAIRSFLQNPSAGFSFWSHTTGLGADVPTTFSYYITGDPLAPLSLLFPLKNLGVAYSFLYVLRIYFAGLASLFFFRKLGANLIGGLSGAALYTFCTFSFYRGQRHPFFAMAMVFFPLLLIGVERVIADRKHGFLIVATFACAVWNFYLFYTLTFFVVLYALFRVIEKAEKGTLLRVLGAEFLHIGGSYLIGVLMAAVILLPDARAILDGTRLAVRNTSDGFYALQGYLTLARSLFTFAAGPNSSYGGFALVSFMLTPVYFMRRKGFTALKGMICVILICLAIPFFGFVLNAFSYSSNRFIFVLGPFLGAVVALVGSDGKRFSKRELIAMAGVLLLATAILFFAKPMSKGRLGNDTLTLIALWAPLVSCWLFWLAMCFVRIIPRLPKSKLIRTYSIPCSILVLVMFSVVVNGNAASRIQGANGVKYPLTSTVGYEFFHTPQEEVAAKASSLVSESENASEDTGLYYDAVENAYIPFARTDKQWLASGPDPFGTTGPGNDSIVENYPGIVSYFSITNGSLQQYMSEIEDRQIHYTVGYRGFDDRASLLSLAAVKQYLVQPENEIAMKYVPYGFELANEVDGVKVYKNNYALPLGFMYTSQIDRKNYDGLTALEKQEALLQGVVIGEPTPSGSVGSDTTNEINTSDASVSSSVPVAAPDTTAVSEIGWQVLDTDGVEFNEENHTIKTKKGSTVTLELTDDFSDSELYVNVEGISFRGGKKKEFKGLTVGYGADSGPEKWDTWVSPLTDYYFGRHSQLVNLGYRPNGAETVTLYFAEKGVVEYSDITISAVSMKDYGARLEMLASNGLQNLVVDPNSVSGTTDCARSGFLYFSIPYSSGWSAKVDGKVVPVSKANTGFLGIEAPAGKHDIKLHYMTPLLPLGFAISAVATVLCIAVCVRQRKTVRAA